MVIKQTDSLLHYKLALYGTAVFCPTLRSYALTAAAAASAAADTSIYQTLYSEERRY